jgi:hypothetical protein
MREAEKQGLSPPNQEAVATRIRGESKPNEPDEHHRPGRRLRHCASVEARVNPSKEGKAIGRGRVSNVGEVITPGSNHPTA